MTNREFPADAGGRAVRRRSGFTLVEVLVAMALILFIMTILAAAFGAASQTVSDLKAAGDLAEKLRAAASAIKRDMGADHCFRNADGAALPLNSPWDPTGTTPQSPPYMGFFRIYQGAPEAQAWKPGATAGVEGADLDKLPSYYQTTTSLHYTINLNGPLRGDYLSALVPASSPLLTDPAFVALYPADQRYQDTGGAYGGAVNLYNSPSAEVALFLVPTGDVTDGGAPGGTLPLYALYRRQLLTTPPAQPKFRPPDYTPAAAVPAGQAGSYPEVSVLPNAGEVSAAPALTFNSLMDLTQPANRFWMARNSPAGVYQTAPGLRYATLGESEALAGAGGYQAADLLMPDVVSFDVRVLVCSRDPTGVITNKGSDFEDLYDLTNAAKRTDPQTGLPWYFPYNNPAFATWAAANNLPTAPMVFDTWSNQGSYAAWQTPGTPASVPFYTDNSGKNTIGIMAIQITLRVWDFKTKKTRQVTIVQQT